MKKAGPRVLDPLAASSAGVAHLAIALRELVLAEAPDAVERVYQNHPSAVREGTRKTMRHVKFRSERDLERPFVRRYIRATADQATADKEPRGPLPGGRGSVSESS